MTNIANIKVSGPFFSESCPYGGHRLRVAMVSENPSQSMWGHNDPTSEGAVKPKQWIRRKCDNYEYKRKHQNYISLKWVT